MIRTHNLSKSGLTTCSKIIRDMHLWEQTHQKQQHNNHNFKCFVFHIYQPPNLCSFAILYMSYRQLEKSKIHS